MRSAREYAMWLGVELRILSKEEILDGDHLLKLISSIQSEAYEAGQSKEWLSMDTAPTEEGEEIIAWMSSDKGFPDQTAKLFYYNGAWCWEQSEGPVKRPDLIHGWQPWPLPPIKPLGDE